MRLVSFKSSGEVKIGGAIDDKVVDLNSVLPAADRIPGDMMRVEIEKIGVLVNPVLAAQR